jgi:O-antigen/teichoic acid export membrane protein
MVLTMSDRFMIKALGNYADVGVYSLGHKIASVLNVFVIQSFQLGFLPIGYKMFHQKDARPFFSKVMTYLVFVLFFVGLGISLFSKEVIILFASSNKSYWVAYTVVPIIVFAFVLRGVNYMVSLGLHYVKKTKYNAYILITAAIFNVVLNYLLIPLIGIYGAAGASVLANALMVLLFLYYSQKFYFIKYESARIFKLFLVGVVILIAGAYIDVKGLEMLWALPVKGLMVISFPIILLLLGFYTKQERAAISGAWRKWRHPEALAENMKSLFKNENSDEKN